MPSERTFDREAGMTLVELMISSTLSLLLVAMTLSVTLANRQLYGTDMVRTRINQNIRSAFDIIETELRQAGERLPSGVPAIEIAHGTSSDVLTLRRNTLDDTLTVCQTVTTGAASNNIQLTTTTSPPPACIYGAQTASFTNWQAYRARNSNVATAYIYDFTSKGGQFFKYDGETNTNTGSAATSVMRIHSQTSAWTRNYPAGSTTVYAMSEWKFAMSTVSGQTDLLQLTQDQDTANVRNITYGVNSIRFTAVMKDGTTKTSLTTADDWTQIQYVTVTMTGSDTYRGKTITSTLSANLFPRNVLSN